MSVTSIVNRTNIRLGILSSLAIVAGCIQEPDSMGLYPSGEVAVPPEEANALLEEEPRPPGISVTEQAG